ncbi:hypothetical protein Plhal304r1_c046g0126931 [Plasmopara halstedii]
MLLSVFSLSSTGRNDSESRSPDQAGNRDHISRPSDGIFDEMNKLSYKI